MSERGKFENEWRAIFEGAEDQPSDKVWSEIKAEVATMEAKKQRNKVVYWRWFGAAASAVILMMVGVYSFNSFYNNVPIKRDQFSLESENNSGVKNGVTPDSSSENNHRVEEKVLAIEKLNKEPDNKPVKQVKRVLNNNKDEVKTSSSKKTKPKEGALSESKKITLLTTNNTEEDNASVVKKESMPSSIATMHTNENMEVDYLPFIDSVGVLAQLNTDIYMQQVVDLTELFKHKNKKHNNLWAGLSMGGGSFNPNVNGGSFGNTVFESTASNLSAFDYTSKSVAADQAVESPSFAYNFSMDFGKFVSRKIIIESGVEYAKYSSQASSNLTSNVNQAPEVFLRNTNVNSFSLSDLQTANTYQLLNSYEYISIPISVGYVLFDRKIGMLISSGFSSDLFLNNTLQDQSGQYASSVQKNGGDSPFRPININALVGGEIYYSWNQNYVIAFDPGYRVSLTGITKQEANFKSHPSSFFLGLKFKYLL
ncbi:MAG: hypothetical protein OEX22_07845 [Cyclobacteriaceae bacterium]|nr:hypothetical protein [Cyclobacteriaceae bacterium]